ncbi:hypothetical protein PITC_009880 [Penicillium italicum]|uniref:Uncharacterized protein n=1 Tax=Penicillium italicum TaxID=40296 RepID=A0A0A2LEU3_PENIT|nr:hypothetical protein PITC_009880 [Penicillium italicum]
MTSVNTTEEQAIAFLLACVETSQKGKRRKLFSYLVGFVANIDNQQQEYYFSIVKNAKEFEHSDKYPEIPGDPSWQSITADDVGPIVIFEESYNAIA